MFISSEKEENSWPLDHGNCESLKSSPPIDSNLDNFHGLPLMCPCDMNGAAPEHQKNELQQLITNLEGEIAELRLKEQLLDKKRKEALDKILDVKGSIRVFCRVRPFLPTGRKRVCQPVSFEMEKVVVMSGGRKEFRFDKVFHQAATQEDIFCEVLPILRSALDGNNVCIFAYGQTGMGKTFTMDGTDDQPGIIPRALEELFHQASVDNSSSLRFSMSMLEIYMGSLRDLLAPKSATAVRCNLNIQTDPKGMVEIEGLTEVEVPDVVKAKKWYGKGRRARCTSWTNVNETSSRSHCLVRISIYRHGNDPKAKPKVSKLWMVDLGGSERLLKTGATGQTLDEGRAINLSLSALGDVIAALRRKKGHVPYRNSKLTQILKDSLGSRSKVLMLVHISPCEEDIGETTCSLSFACRARAIDTSREPLEDMSKKKSILELECEMKEAEKECYKIRNHIQKAAFLLTERRKLLQPVNQPPEDTEVTPKNSKQDAIDSNPTTRITDKGMKRTTPCSLPRFMTSTVASRQRQCTSEIEIVKRAKSIRSVIRSSLQVSSSQSLSYSDIRLKTFLRVSTKMSRQAETKIAVATPRDNGLNPKTTLMPRPKILTSSDPNLKVTLPRHRRRMSDLI